MKDITDERMTELWGDFLENFLTEQSELFHCPRKETERVWRTLYNVRIWRERYSDNGIVISTLYSDTQRDLMLVRDEIKDFFASHFGERVNVHIEWRKQVYP